MKTPSLFEERVCTSCKKSLPITEYNRTNAKYLRAICKTCQRDYYRKKAQERKERFGQVVTHRVCPDCKENKLASEFWKSSYSTDGLYVYCKECHAKQRQGKRVEKQQYDKNYYLKRKSKYIEGGTAKEYHRSRYFKNKHGISVEEVESMRIAQESRCGICREEFALSELHVDHDHATGKIRELLCRQCNQALGLFKESEAALLGAVEYLRRHKRE